LQLAQGFAPYMISFSPQNFLTKLSVPCIKELSSTKSEVSFNSAQGLASSNFSSTFGFLRIFAGPAGFPSSRIIKIFRINSLMDYY
jgi:hypothetical protein